MDRSSTNGWNVNEEDVIHIGPEVIPEQPAEADGGHNEAPRPQAARATAPDDTGAPPFAAARKVILVACSVGVVLVVAYILDYWGIIDIPFLTT
ncbi:MAG: hypothetical protein LBD25_06005 [Coriobacteriales bacterium]|nr:hypothetical protein [Coriobacteriales bacterium]